MKIEKINENKIRITLNLDDLKEQNIDFHDFMSSPIESQSLFLDMLSLAEKKIGFTTENYKVSIEALALSTGDFVFTVTRSKDSSTTKKKKNIHAIRKPVDLSKKLLIYSFNTFDDFVDFCSCLDYNTLHSINKISKTAKLYLLENNYYLVLADLNFNYSNLKEFCSLVTEFSNYVSNSDVFESKLKEYGKIIIKQSAITTCVKYF